MRNKRNLSVCVIVLLFLAIVAVFFCERAPITDTDSLEIYSVIYQQSNLDDKDITSEIDIDKLKILLTSMRVSVVPTVGDVYHSASKTYEINCIYKDKSLHMYISDTGNSKIYTGNFLEFQIKNHDAWLIIMDNTK